jgi:hypothetical protein
MPFLGELGFELAGVEHVGRERPAEIHQSRARRSGRRQPRLILLDDADLDTPDLGHLLALHLRDQRLILGSSDLKST